MAKGIPDWVKSHRVLPDARWRAHLQTGLRFVCSCRRGSKQASSRATRPLGLKDDGTDLAARVRGSIGIKVLAFDTFLQEGHHILKHSLPHVQDLLRSTGLNITLDCEKSSMAQLLRATWLCTMCPRCLRTHTITKSSAECTRTIGVRMFNVIWSARRLT